MTHHCYDVIITHQKFIIDKFSDFSSDIDFKTKMDRDLRYIRPYYYALIDSTMDYLKSNILITHYCKIQLEYYSSRSMIDLKKLYYVFLLHLHSTCV